MSRPIHVTTPENNLGVWKAVDEVAPPRRFGNLSPSAFPHAEPWDAYVDHRTDTLSATTQERYDRAGKSWQAFMAEKDRHYALADPAHVEAWLQKLHHSGPGGSRTVRTLYSNYFAMLSGFYDWLMTHAEYRHAYNPCIMAAANEGIAQEVWGGTY